MSAKFHATGSRFNRNPQETATLQTVAQRVGLTRGTISAALNNSPASRSIPQHTKERIFAAAKELNYQPNFFARSLRKKRSNTIGVLVREITDTHGALVIAGIESFLRQKEYFFMMGIHSDDPSLLERYSRMLVQRGVEGFITMDLNLRHDLPLPTVEIETRNGEMRTAGSTETPSHGSSWRVSAITHRERLQSLGETAAKALLAQIEQGN
jgi:LacI family transcriptional regulator